MRKLLIIACWVVCVPMGAQTTHLDSVLAEARYLKSICKIDEAIDKLSELVTPEGFDEQVLAELADCHFQSGSKGIGGCRELF